MSKEFPRKGVREELESKESWAGLDEIYYSPQLTHQPRTSARFGDERRSSMSVGEGEITDSSPHLCTTHTDVQPCVGPNT